MIGAVGPVVGLLIAFVLIGRRVPPVLCLVVGAAAGGLLGGAGLKETGGILLRGGWSMVPSAVCILASGILAGALIQTGSAEKLARSVLRVLGRRWALVSVAGAVMLLTAAGVFVDIAVITAAPIAMTIARKTGRSRSAVLLAMIGGGKAGNIISPNPNTIAAAKAFDLDLTGMMAVNLLPAACAFLTTILIASAFRKVQEAEAPETEEPAASLPPLWAAVSGPLTVLGLLALRPLVGVELDPALVLPVGGLVCILLCGKIKETGQIALSGLREVFGVALLLLGTGTIAGVIQASNLQLEITRGLEVLRMPAFLLAPLSGILMGGAAASTTAGTAIACQTFGPTLLDAGVPALSAAAMIHAGATVLDSLPHGSFFHATAGCADLTMKQRLALIPGEAAIGLVSTFTAALLYLFLR